MKILLILVFFQLSSRHVVGLCFPFSNPVRAALRFRCNASNILLIIWSFARSSSMPQTFLQKHENLTCISILFSYHHPNILSRRSAFFSIFHSLILCAQHYVSVAMPQNILLSKKMSHLWYHQFIKFRETFSYFLIYIQLLFSLYQHTLALNSQRSSASALPYRSLLSKIKLVKDSTGCKTSCFVLAIISRYHAVWAIEKKRAI